MRGFAGAVVVISHDRAFLDATCPPTAELGLLKFRQYLAPYTRYLQPPDDDPAPERLEVDLHPPLRPQNSEFIPANLARSQTNPAPTPMSPT